MGKRRTALVVAAVVAAMVAAAAVVLWPSVGGREVRLTCHKCLMFGAFTWTNDNNTVYYPNVGGVGSRSLAELDSYDGPLRLGDTYRYVPGLKADDPADLVLLYTTRPTRFVWHGDHPSLFRARRWVVVAPDFGMSPEPRGRGELSDWIDTPQLKARLRKTLDYLKANDRPFWTNVVAEHGAFLGTVGQ